MGNIIFTIENKDKTDSRTFRMSSTDSLLTKLQNDAPESLEFETLAFSDDEPKAIVFTFSGGLQFIIAGMAVFESVE